MLIRTAHSQPPAMHTAKVTFSLMGNMFVQNQICTDKPLRLSTKTLGHFGGIYVGIYSRRTNVLCVVQRKIGIQKVVRWSAITSDWEGH